VLASGELNMGSLGLICDRLAGDRADTLHCIASKIGRKLTHVAKRVTDAGGGPPLDVSNCAAGVALVEEPALLEKVL
jgi:hypothetical protein